MGTILVLVILPFPIYAELVREPGPGGTTDASDVRNLECERLSLEEASRRYPGEVRAQAPRGDFQERDALVCTQRIFAWGERDARDEAILSSLSVRARDIVSDARTGAGGQPWIVHTHYPEPAVAQKIAFAVKTQLAEAGEPVSDRRAWLSAKDVEELARMGPAASAPEACRRYEANDSLKNQRLLAIYIVHPEETALHAGLCERGEWRWLR